MAWNGQSYHLDRVSYTETQFEHPIYVYARTNLYKYFYLYVYLFIIPIFHVRKYLNASERRLELKSQLVYPTQG